jgi:flagellar biosynthesis protein
MPDTPIQPPSLPINGDEELTPSNIRKKKQSSVAVALTTGGKKDDAPRITAAGRGKIAEQILQLAFANGVKVREDSALAEMLTKIELDSPIPSEAFLAVAEVLSYVYKANGEPNPFDVILSLEKMKEAEKNNGST